MIELNKKIEYQVEENEVLEDIVDRFKVNIDEVIEYNHLKNKEIKWGDILILPVRPIWRTASIYQILKDEIYIGTLVQHKNEVISYKNKKERKIPEEERIKVPHCHTPIIDNDTWQIVKKRLNDGGKIRICKNGDVALFSRKIFCDACGHTFYRNKAHVKKGEIFYWSCGNNLATARYLCNNTKSIKEDEIYKYVLDEINKQIAKYYDEKLIKKKYFEIKETSKVENAKKILCNELDDIENKIKKKESMVETLYEDRVNGDITIEEFRSIKDKNDIAILNMRKRAEKIVEELRSFESKNSQIVKEKLFKKYKKLELLDRIIIDEFISKIRIGSYNKQTKTRKVTIDWNI